MSHQGLKLLQCVDLVPNSLRAHTAIQGCPHHAVTWHGWRDLRWISKEIGLSGSALVSLDDREIFLQARVNHQLIGIGTYPGPP